MRRTILACALAAAACGGGGGGGGGPDARSVDAAHPDAAASCHILFLNFDGVILTAGADHAPTNVSSIVSGQSPMIPAFRVTSGTRLQTIQAFQSQIQTALAPYGVAVTTTRPTSGDYDMIVFGGAPADIGAPSGVVAMAPSSPGCTGTADGIAFIFDAGGFPDAELGNLAIGAYGLVHSVPMSTVPSDCMCFADSHCGTATTACTIGGAGTPRDPQAANCGTGATFDENAAFSAALTCP